MGFFEKIFGKKAEQQAADKQAFEYFRMLTGYTPAFTTWDGALYESDLIRASLDAYGRHCRKLVPQIIGSAKPNLKSRLDLSPNDWQTWDQFLYQVVTILLVRNNCFIVPVLGEYGETNGIIPVAPDHWELVAYKGEPYLRFFFENGKRKAIELRKAGILTRFQYKNQLFGEGNKSLDPTLELIHIQNQGIMEGIKSAATYRFTAQMANFLSDADLAKEQQRFDDINFNGKSSKGVLLFPFQWKDVKQVTPHNYTIDAEQQKTIETNVFNYFGTNEDVIQNKAIGDAWLAFYEGAIEPFAIQLSTVMEKMLYTERERAFGNRIFFTSNRLQYMSNVDKLNVSAQMADRGLLTRNEIREIWQLPPLPEPYGSQIPARGEYYSINEAQETQTEDEVIADAN